MIAHLDVDDRCWGQNLLVIFDKFEMQKTEKRGKLTKNKGGTEIKLTPR